MKCSAYKPFYLTFAALTSSFIFEERIKLYEFKIVPDVKSASIYIQIRKRKHTKQDNNTYYYVSFETLNRGKEKF